MNNALFKRALEIVLLIIAARLTLGGIAALRGGCRTVRLPVSEAPSGGSASPRRRQGDPARKDATDLLS